MLSIDFKKVVQALKKTASSVKTEESELKFKVKSSESTNIKAAIEKMINKFINLILAMRVQSNQIQENSDHGQEEAQTKGILTCFSCFYCGKSGHCQSQYYEYQSDVNNRKSDSDKKYESLEERTSVNVETIGEAKNSQKTKIAILYTQHTGQFITYQNNQASVNDYIMKDIESINQKKPEIQNKIMKKQRSRYSATDHLFSQICNSTDANKLMG
ncbi:uncharacterized protein CIMG_13124 [Coccidioides immitis RS]|uniref:Uncharacterized protein n=1 Tax=Coccidioides immitis (strain RS) TaxID=246410 RepID=J3K9X1_COCIM|nr:uncharacterized protein CIMG_13124 [Coccidioides immitis RS]EAS31754.3 hypothetical protein CIMG_13124 [Coccidioides immitis RS]